MSHSTCNSSKTYSVLLGNVDFPTLDAARAFVETSNIAYSDDPMRVSAAYTYYWKLAKPPDNSYQLLAILSIAVGYTILVVMYCTWRLCGRQQRTSSHLVQRLPEVSSCCCVAENLWQSNNSVCLSPESETVVSRVFIIMKGREAIHRRNKDSRGLE